MALAELHHIRCHDDKVWTLAWHHSGQFIATGSSDKLIKVWGKDESGGFELKTTLDGAHTRTIRSLAWSPVSESGTLVLASSSFDATTCLWMQESSETGELNLEPYQTLEGQENEVKCVAWSVSGTYVATCSRDKTIWIFEEEEGEVMEYSCNGVLSGHSQDVKYVKWHPNRD